MADIKTLYLTAKTSGRNDDITAYTEAVTDIVENHPIDFLSNLEYIISSDIGLEKLNDFVEKYGLSIAVCDPIIECLEKCVEKCNNRGKDSSLYIEALDQLYDFKESFSKGFMMFESYANDDPEYLEAKGFFVPDNVKMIRNQKETNEILKEILEEIKKFHPTVKEESISITESGEIEVFEEKSHGKLKFDFRYVYDANTGHLCKIVYSLDNIEITNVGDYHLQSMGYDKKNPDPKYQEKWKEAREGLRLYSQKTIRDKGNLDHASKGQKVLAIVDEVTHKNLKKIMGIGVFSIDKSLRINNLKVDKNALKELAAKGGYYDKEGKFRNAQPFPIEVGKVDDAALFKSTRALRPSDIPKMKENITSGERLMTGRGAKLDDIDFDHYDRENKKKPVAYKHPSKREIKANPEIYKKEYVNAYYSFNKKGTQNNKLAAGMIQEFGEAAIPDLIVTACSIGESAVDQLFEYLNNIYDDPVTCQWIIECVDEYILEKSNGRLKYDFRLGFDYDTGHAIKIVYSLDDINIDIAGGAYRDPKLGHKKSEENVKLRSSKRVVDQVKSTIAKKGDLDHASHGQKVLAIIDMKTKERLQSAHVVGLYNLGVRMSFDRPELLKQDLNYIHNEYRKNQFPEVKVGEIDDVSSFKSTKLFKSKTRIDSEGMPHNPGVNKLDGAYHLKYGRGAKMDDVDPRSTYLDSDTPKYIHPSKKDKKRNPDLYEKKSYFDEIYSNSLGTIVESLIVDQNKFIRESTIMGNEDACVSYTESDLEAIYDLISMKEYQIACSESAEEIYQLQQEVFDLYEHFDGIVNEDGSVEIYQEGLFSNIFKPKSKKKKVAEEIAVKLIDFSKEDLRPSMVKAVKGIRSQANRYTTIFSKTRLSNIKPYIAIGDKYEAFGVFLRNSTSARKYTTKVILDEFNQPEEFFKNLVYHILIECSIDDENPPEELKNKFRDVIVDGINETMKQFADGKKISTKSDSFSTTIDPSSVKSYVKKTTIDTSSSEHESHVDLFYLTYDIPLFISKEYAFKGIDKEIFENVDFVNLVPIEESQALANTTNKYTGKAPGYLRSNHDLGWGEDDDSTPSSIEELKRPSAEGDSDSKPESDKDEDLGIDSETSEEETEDEKDKSSKEGQNAVNNYYYYTYTNSNNKNSNSFNKSSDSHEDHSVNKRIRSDGDNNSHQTENTKPWELNIFGKNLFTEEVGDADDGKPESDHPIKDALQDVDRGLTKVQQGAKKKVQGVMQAGSAFMKPIKRTHQWVTKLCAEWKDKDENKIKEKMADPHARKNIFSGIAWAIKTGSFLKAGLLLNPVFIFLSLTKRSSKKSKEFRLRNEMIGELKMELEVIKEKRKDADYAGDRKAKYKLMRLENEIHKKLLRVGGSNTRGWRQML